MSLKGFISTSMSIFNWCQLRLDDTVLPIRNCRARASLVACLDEMGMFLRRIMNFYEYELQQQQTKKERWKMSRLMMTEGYSYIFVTKDSYWFILSPTWLLRLIYINCFIIDFTWIRQYDSSHKRWWTNVNAAMWVGIIFLDVIDQYPFSYPGHYGPGNPRSSTSYADVTTFSDYLIFARCGIQYFCWHWIEWIKYELTTFQNNHKSLYLYKFIYVITYYLNKLVNL